MNNIYKQYLNNKVVKLALPFFIFMIGGSFYLSEFQSLRFKYGRKSKFIDQQEIEKLGIEFNPQKGSIDEEYEKLKDKDWDNWDNKRISRPWDENTPTNQ